MVNKLVKVGKWALSCLNVLYLIIIIVNVALLQRGVTNGMIEAYGVLGYVFTYALSFLMAGGCFVVFTIAQSLIYHVKKKSVSKSLVALIVFEVIKIVGTFFYIYIIDCSNIRIGGAVTAFIILGMVAFALIAVTDIALMILMITDEKQRDLQ